MTTQKHNILNIGLKGIFKGRDGRPIKAEDARGVLAAQGRWPSRPASFPAHEAECDFWVLAAFQDSTVQEFEQYLN